ncbi:Ccc1 family protein [Dioscorea alata]|uniref:Ccc1 family protein n=1 Tax=Dioscorea alata TaxID=55571 RepID=A0ACB7VZI4_DIOAL|nr:Ccc1 family protein [Dioscorea alata]
MAETRVTVNEPKEEENENKYVQRAQWLRAAVLGANDGLVSTASLMMGVGAVKHDAKAMMISGFAGLVGGAFSMAIGEFVSVYSQLDIELANLKRVQGMMREEEEMERRDEEVVVLPNPVQAAVASAVSFGVGAMVPLVGAGFIRRNEVRMVVVVVVVTVALVVFGTVGAVLGRGPVVKGGLRVLIGGWLAMASTFGLMKLFGTAGL